MQATNQFIASLPAPVGPYCIYEPVTPRIQAMRVLLINNLLGDVSHLSEAAAREPNFDAEKWVALERKIAGMAMANIEGNVRRLIAAPEITTIHLADLNAESVARFDPDAIVLSGTLRDFDLYAPHLIDGFNQFITQTNVPVMAICGGHQMVGQAFGARIVTLNGQEPAAQRHGRLIEYQYRFVKITDAADPIFAGVDEFTSTRWQKYTNRKCLLRVWQNHGLQLDRLPDGFKRLARGYLSEVQMMARRTATQLIYGVQFHIEKSFQDWQLDKFWEHRNESRDGRLLFDNFLVEALRFRGKAAQLATGKIALPLAEKAQAAGSGGSGSAPATGF